MRAAPGLIVLALLMIPLGVPLSPWLGSLGASVQRVVPAGSSTEAFAWTFAAVTVAMAAAFLAAGELAWPAPRSARSGSPSTGPDSSRKGNDAAPVRRFRMPQMVPSGRFYQ